MSNSPYEHTSIKHCSSAQVEASFTILHLLLIKRSKQDE